MSDDYSSWTNRETWCVNLWMNNQAEAYQYWRSRARDMWAASKGTKTLSREENASISLSEVLKAEFEAAMPTPGDMWTDLLQTSLGRVNWRKIAESWIDSVE